MRGGGPWTGHDIYTESPELRHGWHRSAVERQPGIDSDTGSVAMLGEELVRTGEVGRRGVASSHLSEAAAVPGSPCARSLKMLLGLGES